MEEAGVGAGAIRIVCSFLADLRQEGAASSMSSMSSEPEAGEGATRAEKAATVA
jgi:hypothetical protein